MPTTVIASIMSIKNSLPEDAEFVVFVVVEVVVSEVVAEVAVVEVVVVDSASEAELLLLFLFTTKLVPRPKREKFFYKDVYRINIKQCAPRRHPTTFINKII